VGSPKSFYKDISLDTCATFVSAWVVEVGSDKGGESSKLNTKFGHGVRVSRRLYAYPRFSCWCPCLAKRECERKHQDECAKGNAGVCGDSGAEISRTSEF